MQYVVDYLDSMISSVRLNFFDLSWIRKIDSAEVYSDFDGFIKGVISIVITLPAHYLIISD